jgi:hypothetical protein
MLRHLQRAAWTAAFICLVSGFGFAVWKASQQVLLGEQAAQHAANKNVSAGQDEPWKPLGLVWRETRNDPTFWVAFFTFVLAASTIGLWIVAICTLRHGRETAERQLRAYISVDGGSARIVETIGTNFVEGFVSLKNSGQTPAYNCKSWVRIEIGTTSHPPFDQKSFGRGGVIIGPGTAFNLPVHWQLNPADLAALRAETKRIYIWGETEYDDIFGHNRFLRFYQQNGKEIPGKGWPLETADRPHEWN